MDFTTNLTLPDAEHTDVSVEDRDPRHMLNVSRDDVIRLWLGDIAGIDALPWCDGYG